MLSRKYSGGKRRNRTRGRSRSYRGGVSIRRHYPKGHQLHRTYRQWWAKFWEDFWNWVSSKKPLNQQSPDFQRDVHAMAHNIPDDAKGPEVVNMLHNQDGSNDPESGILGDKSQRAQERQEASLVVQERNKVLRPTQSEEELIAAFQAKNVASLRSWLTTHKCSTTSTQRTWDSLIKAGKKCKLINEPPKSV
jgi:hypothetical protein